MKRFTASCLIIIALFQASVSDAQAQQGLTFGKLDNGIIYVIDRRTDQKGKVAVEFGVFAGYLDENPETQSEAAHIIEHYAAEYSGTEPGRLRINALNRDPGVDFVNAYSGEVRTGYNGVIDSEKLHDFIDKSVGILSIPEFIDVALRKEVRAVQAEGGSWHATDRTAIWEASNVPGFAARASQTRNRVQWLDRISLGAIWQFYKKWYRPNCAYLVIVGDVQGDVEKSIKRQFSAIPGSSSDACQRPALKGPRAVVVTSQKNSSSVEIWAADSSPSPSIDLKFDEQIRNEVASEVLRMRFATLAASTFDGIRVRVGGPKIELRTWEPHGEVRASITVDGRGTAYDKVKLSTSELGKVARFGATGEEIRRAKFAALGRFQALSLSNRVSRHVVSLQANQRPDVTSLGDEVVARKIQSVTNDGIKAWASGFDPEYGNLAAVDSKLGSQKNAEVLLWSLYEHSFKFGVNTALSKATPAFKFQIDSDISPIKFGRRKVTLQTKIREIVGKGNRVTITVNSSLGLQAYNPREQEAAKCADIAIRERGIGGLNHSQFSFYKEQKKISVSLELGDSLKNPGAKLKVSGPIEEISDLKNIVVYFLAGFNLTDNSGMLNGSHNKLEAGDVRDYYFSKGNVDGIINWKHQICNEQAAKVSELISRQFSDPSKIFILLERPKDKLEMIDHLFANFQLYNTYPSMKLYPADDKKTMLADVDTAKSFTFYSDNDDADVSLVIYGKKMVNPKLVDWSGASKLIDESIQYRLRLLDGLSYRSGSQLKYDEVRGRPYLEVRFNCISYNVGMAREAVIDELRRISSGIISNPWIREEVSNTYDSIAPILNEVSESNAALQFIVTNQK